MEEDWIVSGSCQAGEGLAVKVAMRARETNTTGLIVRPEGCLRVLC